MIEETKINIGKLALLGDVWYQIMDYRDGEYLLHTRQSWTPEEWIKEIKDK